MKENIEHLVSGPQSSEPSELLNWVIIAAVSIFAGLVIFFFWIDLMYFSLDLIAFASMCAISYAIYNKYNGENVPEDNCDTSQAKNNDVENGFNNIDEQDGCDGAGDN